MKLSEIERKVWALLQAENMVPKNTTKEGHAAYMKMKRDMQKQVKVRYPSFLYFLQHYDVALSDVETLLGSEIIWKDMEEVQRDIRRRLKKQ